MTSGQAFAALCLPAPDFQQASNAKTGVSADRRAHAQSRPPDTSATWLLEGDQSAWSILLYLIDDMMHCGMLVASGYIWLSWWLLKKKLL